MTQLEVKKESPTAKRRASAVVRLRAGREKALRVVVVEVVSPPERSSSRSLGEGSPPPLQAAARARAEAAAMAMRVRRFTGSRAHGSQAAAPRRTGRDPAGARGRPQSADERQLAR